MPAPQSFQVRLSARAGAAVFFLPVASGLTLAQAIYLSGLLQPPSLCSGIGRCGRCRMRILHPGAIEQGRSVPPVSGLSASAEAGVAASTDPAGAADFAEAARSCALPTPSAEDRALFSEQEIAAGWRLGCRHFPRAHMVVELPDEILPLPAEADPPAPADLPASSVPTTPAAEVGASLAGGEAVSTARNDRTRFLPGGEPLLAGEHPLFLSVDFGTTSVEWRVDAGLSGEPRLPLAGGKEVNPQAGAGSDVIARLAFAQRPAGAERLQTLTLRGLRRIVQRAEAAAGGKIAALGFAGNPSMCLLTLGKATRSLASAPYSLPYIGGEWEILPDLPPVWVAPLVSPFIGGDVAAGYASLALAPEEKSAGTQGCPHTLRAGIGTEATAYISSSSPSASSSSSSLFPFVTADLGTNAEILLAESPDTATAISVPAGPALEGTGLECGTEARPGAVTGFTLTPDGLVPLFFEEGVPPSPRQGHPHRRPGYFPRAVSGAAAPDTRGLAAASPSRAVGITGTGYLSLIHGLINMRVLTRDGHFVPDAASGASASPFLQRMRAKTGAGHLVSDASGGLRLTLPAGLHLSAADVEELLKVKAAFSLGLRMLLTACGCASRAPAGIYLAGSIGAHVDTAALENLGFFPPGTALRLRPVGNASLTGTAFLLRNENARAIVKTWAARVRTLHPAEDPAFQQAYAEHMRFAW